jgi:hypothetical protein
MEGVAPTSAYIVKGTLVAFRWSLDKIKKKELEVNRNSSCGTVPPYTSTPSLPLILLLHLTAKKGAGVAILFVRISA